MDGKEQRNPFEDPIALIFIIVVVFVGAMVLWNTIHTYFATIIVYVRYVEAIMLWLPGKYFNLPLFNQAYELIYGLCKPDNNSIIGLCTRDMSTITLGQLLETSIPFNIIFSIFFLKKIYCFNKEIRSYHPKIKFKKEHNVFSFINEQKINFKHISLYEKLDLLDKDLTDPVYGMSETVRQFCFKNKLIDGWQEMDDKSFVPTLNIQKTLNILSAQLGQVWSGNKLNELSVSETIIIAIAVPRVAATDSALSNEEFDKAMSDSNNLLMKMWEYFDLDKIVGDGVVKDEHLHPSIDLEEPRKLIVKYYQESEKVRAIFNKHAYVRTIIYGLITESRRLGVLSAADLGWMQFFDREMYFILSTIGRQTAFAEACGVLSHFLYEIRIGDSYPEPLVDKGMEGIKFIMTEVIKFTKEDIKHYNKIN